MKALRRAKMTLKKSEQEQKRSNKKVNQQTTTPSNLVTSHRKQFSLQMPEKHAHSTRT